jgi:hypothetical protein
MALRRPEKAFTIERTEDTENTTSSFGIEVLYSSLVATHDAFALFPQLTKPSSEGRGRRASAFSSAEARRVRGYLHDEQNEWQVKTLAARLTAIQMAGGLRFETMVNYRPFEFCHFTSFCAYAAEIEVTPHPSGDG